ncbi:NB-ARC domains-containing protein [Artemisia annua]|uniref:NB-ARC domains-containing protein n=1 Tax=Artemisia annua TaxID=35608 RepID=A0A2U1KBX0_ARTAN|nr:NB-ARC domains-containing protein [Artemisia annua]
MEFVSAILGPVVNVLMAHITKKLGYLTSSTEHVKRMKNRMQYLESQSAAIEGHMKENELNNREIPEPAKVWLKDLKKTKEDIDNISSNDIGCFNFKKEASKPDIILAVMLKYLLEESIPKGPASHQHQVVIPQNVFNSELLGKLPTCWPFREAIAEHTGKPLTDNSVKANWHPKLSKRFEYFHRRKEKESVYTLTMFDLTMYFGNLSNLEVLSFATLALGNPTSALRKTEEAELLDVTGFYNLVYR